MTLDKRTVDARDLLRDFNASLGVSFRPPADLFGAAQSALDGCVGWPVYRPEERGRRLMALINAKLKLNKDRLQVLLDALAKSRVFPNYHDKAELLECFDYADEVRFQRWLAQTHYDNALFDFFDPTTPSETLHHLHELLRTGTVNRSDARACSLSERQIEILRSLFGSYIFHAFPTEAMHRYFNPDCRAEYCPDFYSHLLAFHSHALRRDCALVYLRLTSETIKGHGGKRLRDALCAFIRDTYDRLANHCVLAILVQPFDEGAEDGQWRLFSDLVLYAEKHREVQLQAGYFQPRDIQAATAAHVPGLDVSQARFDLANEGFFFRDCFILLPPGNEGRRPGDSPGDLLLLFDKNERDETVIPCPACRSANVAGNSYPTLGVRSWECRNPICPERSAFDRGNRYSLSSIIKQEAIKSEADQIPEESLKRWKLDVVHGVDANAVPDMLIRHYTLHGDTAVFVNAAVCTGEMHGRRIVHEEFEPKAIAEEGVYARFQASALFSRFVVDREPPASAAPVSLPHRVKDAAVYHGDCFHVLSGLEESSVDGAATSPPYYNARSYSTWPNIYCYLHDMYNAARAVHRVLKPGSYYLFNIFDYFDNENSIVFSAMGKKRIVLGAYVINLFRRVGFELRGNVAWYKGEIEGKRNYNQGNHSPYYQAPLNCWEHCLVFRKPGGRACAYRFPVVLDAKPVYKMVRGENVLGHTAPFPPAVPELLVCQMAKGECVLDPFSGSMTTGRTAHYHGLRSISIELQKEYCDLGIRLLERDTREGCSAPNGSFAQPGQVPKGYFPEFFG
jgi:DNA modification methylase